MPKFVKGVSGNPNGRPKLPQEIKDLKEQLTPLTFEVLVRQLKSKDPRIAQHAAIYLQNRFLGTPATVLQGSDGPAIRVEEVNGDAARAKILSQLAILASRSGTDQDPK